MRYLFIFILLISISALSAQLDHADQKLLTEYLENGCLLAELQTSISENDTIFTINSGRQYTFSDLHFIGIADSIITIVTNRFNNNDPLSITNLNKLFNDIILIYANSGYPFAKLNLQNIEISAQKVHLTLLIIEGPITDVGNIIYDSLQTTYPRTLAGRIEIKEGMPYREDDLLNSTDILSQLEFCKLLAKPLVTYNSRNNKSDITFYVQDEKNLFVNGLLYLNPDNSLSGLLESSLLNPLGGGRKLSVLWSRKDNSSQKLLINLLLPYFSGLPIDLKLDLAQEDRDSSFISTYINAGFEYHLQKYWRIGGGFGWEKITPEEGQVSPSARELSIGINSGYDRRDDLNQTHSGLIINTNLTSSYRRSFDFVDSISSGYNTKLAITGKHWLPLSRNLVLSNKVNIFQIKSDFKPIPAEMLIQLGGSHSLRGYREDSFRASQGILSATELSWYLDRKFLLRLFADNGYIKTLKSSFNLSGFGMGFQLNTTSGKISLDFSMGESKSLNDLLVHISFGGRF